MTSRLFLLLSVFMLLNACMVGPNYVRPTAPLSKEFKEAHGKRIIDGKYGRWKLAEPSDSFDRGRWWEMFHDETLNKLEDQLNFANQSVINAYYNFQQACAVVAQAKSSLLPTLDGSLSVTRQKSGSGINVNNNVNLVNPNLGTGNTGRISWLYEMSFNAAWELDIWGQVRRTIEAAEAGAMASNALLAATRLSMQASLAQYYFQLRGLDADQRLLNRTVESYRRTLRLTRNEYQAGTVARADVVQAQSQVESAQSQAINNKILRQQYEHAIAVLIGRPPAVFAIDPQNYPVSPPPIPIMVPSALLERRPDIAQAERLMAQANANIGVAVAAYFPSVTLTASANVVGRTFGSLFSFPAWAWAYGGQLMQTILDGGYRRAVVAAARATYYATIASYRQTILAAFQDVEDNLVALDTLNKQIIVQRRATASATRALQIVLNQYKAGTVPYISVMVQQVQTYTAEKAEIDVNYQRMTAAVNLVRALGGGWDGILCA